MFSSYHINWAELTQTEKWIFFGIFIVFLVIGIIEHLYLKHKEKTKNDKN